MPFGWVEGIGALFSAGMGAYEASQSMGMAQQQQTQSSTVFGEQQYYAQLLQNLMQDPSQATTLPNYQFALGQGLDAITRQQAASGGLGSGQMGIALEEFGQGYAENAFTSYEQMLASLSGLTAPSSPSQYGANAIASQGQAYNQLGGQLASLQYLAGSTGGGYSPWGNMWGGGWGGGGGVPMPSSPYAGGFTGGGQTGSGPAWYDAFH